MKPAHTAKSKIGMGDSYGTGFKNKIGRVRGDTLGRIEVPKKNLLKPPKSLA